MIRVLCMLVMISNSLFSQIDKRKGNEFNFKGKKIGGGVPNIPMKSPTSLDLNFKENGFKTAKQKLDVQRKQREREREKERLALKTVTRKSNSRYVEGTVMNFPLIDMDLGSFHTQSKNIHIRSYDYGNFDGDRFDISHNYEKLKTNILLTPKSRVITVPLKKGINRIEVMAVNEGRLSPNTAFFSFYDDKGVLVKEGQWMLAKGARVIAVVVRE